MSEPIPGKISENEINRDEQADKIIRFMEKLHADEIFATEESKREYIQDLTFDEFKNLLTATNSILRDIPVSQRVMDGEKVYLQKGIMSVDDEYIPPVYEDKDELLKEMFVNIQSMSSEGGKLEDMALLAGASINAIHPFNDGNGRTSRLLYTLLANNYNSSEEQKMYIKQILGEEGRDIVDINPGLIGSEINKHIAGELGLNPKDPLKPVGFWGEGSFGVTKKELDKILSEKPEISEENKRFIEQVMRSDESHDFAHGFQAVYQYLNEKGIAEECKKLFYKEGALIRSRIMANPIVEELKDDEEVEEIRKNYRNIKKSYVRGVMNSIMRPNEYTTAKYDGSKITLRDLFKERGA